MSITAFPVLARILAERGLRKTQIGAIAHHLRRGRRRDRVVLLAFVVAVVTRRRRIGSRGDDARLWPCSTSA